MKGLKQSIAIKCAGNLTITPKLKRIVPLPSGSPTSTSMIVQVTFANPAGLLANRRQSSRLAMFHSSSTDPVYPGIATNSICPSAVHKKRVILC